MFEDFGGLRQVKIGDYHFPIILEVILAIRSNILPIIVDKGSFLICIGDCLGNLGW